MYIWVHVEFELCMHKWRPVHESCVGPSMGGPMGWPTWYKPGQTFHMDKWMLVWEWVSCLHGVPHTFLNAFMERSSLGWKWVGFNPLRPAPNGAGLVAVLYFLGFRVDPFVCLFANKSLMYKIINVGFCKKGDKR